MPNPPKTPDEVKANPSHVSVPNTFAKTNPDKLEKISGDQLTYSLAGLIVGVICVLIGGMLFFGGITGSTTWTAKMVGIESNLSDAAPGGLLFVVGLAVIVATKFGVTIRDS